MSELKERKCEVCNGSIGTMSDNAYAAMGAICDECIQENLEDADEFSSMPA
ncbi:MAG TPA: hypothetical protein VI727_05290 [Candidatus Brocadiaceae bacterium]|nr:hypothetical protein [Candidatus Brocadiaceae bacterium]